MLVQKELGGHISRNLHKLKSLPRAWRELQLYATRWVGGFGWLAILHIPQRGGGGGGGGNLTTRETDTKLSTVRCFCGFSFYYLSLNLSLQGPLSAWNCTHSKTATLRPSRTCISRSGALARARCTDWTTAERDTSEVRTAHETSLRVTRRAAA